MSLYYGYEDKVEKVEGELNMSLNKLSNIPAPFDNLDAISKSYGILYLFLNKR